MLVRLRGTATRVDDWTHKLNLQLPVIYLDSPNYNLCLRSIMLDCNFSHIEHSSQFWSLQTTMVDMTSTNPRQEIASFVSNYNPGSNYNIVYFEPFIKQEYKIQLTELHSSEFFLHTLKKDADLEIDFLEILLEFSRYARI